MGILRRCGPGLLSGRSILARWQPPGSSRGCPRPAGSDKEIHQTPLSVAASGAVSAAGTKSRSKSLPALMSGSDLQGGGRIDILSISPITASVSLEPPGVVHVRGLAVPGPTATHPCSFHQILSIRLSWLRELATALCRLRMEQERRHRVLSARRCRDATRESRTRDTWRRRLVPENAIGKSASFRLRQAPWEARDRLVVPCHRSAPPAAQLGQWLNPRGKALGQNDPWGPA